MRIATWNVNSLRAREDLVLDWLEREDVDVLCMQETKLPDQEFPEDPFGDLDYDVVYYGQPAYNGVALVSHEEPIDVVLGFPDDDETTERRLIAATVDDVRVVCIYLPNGQSYGSEKFTYKLEWINQLHGFLRGELERHEGLVLCGDFNIAPRDVDVHDPDLRGPQSLFVSEEERAAYARLLDLGLTDAFTAKHPDAEKPYTWWDYRAGGWERNRGMRIDHLLVSDAILARTEDVEIHRTMRGEDGPSDHVPVVLTLRDR